MRKENHTSDKSDIDARNMNKDGSMHRSESGFTTWRELKKNSSSQLHRYPSGNNNTSMNFGTHSYFVRKSSSLPNLQLQHKPNIFCGEDKSKSIMNSYGKIHMLPAHVESESSGPSYSPKVLNTSTSSSDQQSNQPAFNLVKLFIKQKANSADTYMDVSSGCWPSDASISADQKIRKKSMYDSGKGSALSKHEEAPNDAEIQYDSLDIPPAIESETVENVSDINVLRAANQQKDLNREVIDSSSHRAHTNGSIDARKQHLANINNNNSFVRDSLKDTLKSISDTSRTSDNITQVFGKSKIPLSLITRSIQTSVLKQSVKVVPPSFLAQLNQNMQSNVQKQAPVYVIYPNYVLPDLEFVTDYPCSQITLSPLALKESFARKRRPMSTADIERLKEKEYKHIADWKSLLSLLPLEYKQMLKHIPDVSMVYNDAQISQKPLFCMNPPIRRNRMASCDCSSYYASSPPGSGSSQPPSSGYEGSSGMLTDNEFPVFDADKLADCNDVPPSGQPKYDVLRKRASMDKSKRSSMSDDTSSVKHNIEKRYSIQDYSSTPKIESDDIPQYYPLQEQVRFNLNPFKTQLPDQTKNNFGLSHRMEYDEETRSRVESFLSNVPKSELKYYAEIANILESIENISSGYDRNELKNQVSCTLAQKRVSFNYNSISKDNNFGVDAKPFNTPPNSPNISITTARRNLEQHQRNSSKSKQNKIQSNRFKRLQIQWELLSKDAHQMENELFTRSRSGGSTPISAPSRIRSKIPRPVSYPAASR